MQNLSETVAQWLEIDGWRIAPTGLAWIAAGARIKVGNYARIGNDAQIGDGAHDAVDIGWCEGYRKCVAHVDGVAYVGAGCRWMTLDEADAHWRDREDRPITRALMMAAREIARINGWKTGSTS